jgi:hypothetical protein
VQGDDHVGEEPEVLRRPFGLTAGLRDRQAGVEGLKLGDALGAAFDAVRDPVQHARPLAGGQPGPGSVGERAVRGPRRAVDVGGAAGGHLRVRLVAYRVGDGEGSTVRAR